LIKTHKLPEGSLVPESLKKKLARNEKLSKDRKAAISDRKDARKVIRKKLKQRARKNEANYRHNQKRLIALRRNARDTGNFFMEPEAKLMFVMRITGINKLAPKARKILKLLRLDQLHKGVFVKVSRPMTNLLSYVQPYIICGYPSLSTVRKLILKRGYGKINRQRIPLSHNEIISDALGEKYGIHGIDDLVNEIYTVGPNFKAVNNFLWAFKLSSPRGGFVRKVYGYNELRRGDWGNREEKINQLLARMN
jgi:large subunit ribosomal protein L7e